MSWQDIEKTDSEDQSKAQDAIRRFCSLCYQLFEQNPLGKEFMKMLDDQYHSPVCPPDKESSWGYFREGQNNLIRQIKNAILVHTRNQGGPQ
jgi:hypothetical protein